MKKFIGLICILTITSSINAQTWQDACLGGWINGDGDGKIMIYKEGDKYYGKITWLREPNEEDGTPKVDDENPDKSKHKQPIMGLVILKNFTFEEGFWKNGSIYDPKNGRTYDCEMWLDGKDKLKIRGYWGIVYRTETWTKAK